MRNPKPKKFTAAQETELTRTEQQLARARIYQYGVQKILKDGEYCDSLAVCAQVLIEAEQIRKAAYNRRAEITRPATPKSKR
jgi:ribosomal protein S26